MVLEDRKFDTIGVRVEGMICYLRMSRVDSGNAMNKRMIEEIAYVLGVCEESYTILVLEAEGDHFCKGADFQAVHDQVKEGNYQQNDPALLFKIFEKLSFGSFTSIAHVQGKVNAGGVGLVAACDIVIATDSPEIDFGLSELLFGLFPACVLPFLVKRIGNQRANYMTLTTRPIDASTAHNWGLVDILSNQSDRQLRTLLPRLNKLSKQALRRYKRCMSTLAETDVSEKRETIVQASKEMFTDKTVVNGIYNFVDSGQFPWESITET